MICHRDIKPENLLVIDRQTTKVPKDGENKMINYPLLLLNLADAMVMVMVMVMVNF